MAEGTTLLDGRSTPPGYFCPSPGLQSTLMCPATSSCCLRCVPRDNEAETRHLVRGRRSPKASTESLDYLEVLEGIQTMTDEFPHSNRTTGPVQTEAGEKGGEILSGS